MFGIVSYEYVKHWMRNIFVAFLMALLCFISAVFLSILRYHYFQYKPFRELNIDEEKSIFTRGIFEDIDKLHINSEYKEIYSEYGSVFYNGNVGELLVYDKWVYQNWEPRLKRGRWFGNKVGDIPEIVIGGNVEGIAPGDIIRIEGIISEKEVESCECKVVGIFQNGTSLLGSNGIRYGTERYSSCYFNTDTDRQMPFFIIMRKDDFKKNSISKLELIKNDWEIISFDTENGDKDIIEQDWNKLNDYIKDSIQAVTYSEFMEKSRDMYYSQIMLYIPLLLFGFILIALVIYNVTRIDLRDSSYSHSIYYLLGENKKKCRRISVYVLLINILISFMFYIGNVIFFSNLAQKKNLVFKLGLDSFVIVGIVYCVLILYTIIVGMFLSRGMTPMDMLRKNRTAV